MSSERWAVGFQVAAAAGLLAAASVIAGGRTSLTAVEGVVAIELGLGILVLAFFNVWLPRGDAVDTTVPIVFATAVSLSPLVAAGVIVVARCAASAMRRRGHTAMATLEQVSRRVLLASGCYLALRALSPGTLGGIATLPTRTHVAAIVASAVLFVSFDLVLEQLHAVLRTGSPLLPLVIASVRLQGWMLAAEMSTAVLTAVLLPTLGYGLGLLITVGLLLVMRQSFALLLEVRASYTATVEVLARSLEAYDPSRRGHAERVAQRVGQAARLVGIQGRRLEDITYAALFHDVGLMGVDDPDDEPGAGSAALLREVGFLSGAVPILQVLDSRGDLEVSVDEQVLVGAYLIAWFSARDIDGEAVPEIARTIGSRLYTSTRRSVDRAIRRVESQPTAASVVGSKVLTDA